MDCVKLGWWRGILDTFTSFEHIAAFILTSKFLNH